MKGHIADSRWLSCYKPKATARVRLFCLPYAGGGASYYRKWSDQLPGTIEVCPVQLPGRENRIGSPPVRTLEGLLPLLGDALAPYLDLPFAIFGYSMGALVGFELAHYLREKWQREPLCLVVAGRRAPHLPSKDPPFFDLPEAEFWKRLQSLDGTPQDLFLHPELLELLGPLLRGDLELCDRYRYRSRPALGCPLVAMAGSEDSEVNRDELDGWGTHTTGAFHSEIYPGGHFFVTRVEATILERIGHRLEILREADTEPTGVSASKGSVVHARQAGRLTVT